MINARAATLSLLLMAFGCSETWAQAADDNTQDEGVRSLSITSSLEECEACLDPVSSGAGAPQVMAGDEVTIGLSREPLPIGMHQARFRASLTDAEKPHVVPAWLPDKTSTWGRPGPFVRVRVPVASPTETTSRFVQIAETDGLRDVAVSGPYALSIAPPANPVIQFVSPTALTFESVVKVKGTGFFAPPEEIKLLVGEIRGHHHAGLADG